jgi:hypothetical protein
MPASAWNVAYRIIVFVLRARPMVRLYAEDELPCAIRSSDKPRVDSGDKVYAVASDKQN